MTSESYFEHVQSIIKAKEKSLAELQHGIVQSELYSTNEKKLMDELKDVMHKITYFYHNENGMAIEKEEPKYTPWALVAKIDWSMKWYLM